MTSTPNATLVYEKGLPDAGPIHLGQGVSVFGTSPTVDVNLDNQYVSRRHFQVSSQDGVFLALIWTVLTGPSSTVNG